METLETLRRDLNVLAGERERLLGALTGVVKTCVALIQTHPNHTHFQLALAKLVDAEEIVQTKLLTAPRELKAEASVLEVMKKVPSTPNMDAVRDLLNALKRPSDDPSGGPSPQ